MHGTKWKHMKSTEHIFSFEANTNTINQLHIIDENQIKIKNQIHVQKYNTENNDKITKLTTRKEVGFERLFSSISV